MVEMMNGNTFLVQNTEQYDYWMSYTNYIKRIFSQPIKKNRYYMKNMREAVMISCLDVLATLDLEQYDKGQKLSDKCVKLGSDVLGLIEEKRKD